MYLNSTLTWLRQSTENDGIHTTSFSLVSREFYNDIRWEKTRMMAPMGSKESLWTFFCHDDTADESVKDKQTD